MIRVKISIRLLLLISLLADFATAFTYPIFPLFLQDLQLSIVFISMADAAGEAALGGLQLISGVWSDRRQDRRLFIRLGLGVSGFAFMLYGLTLQPAVLFFARVSRSVGEGVRIAPQYAYLASLSRQLQPQRSRLGYVFGLNKSAEKIGVSLGMSLAIILFTQLNVEYGTLFLLTALPIGIALLSSLWLLPGRFKAVSTPDPLHWRDLISVWRQANKGLKSALVFGAAYALLRSSDVLILLRAREVINSDTNLLIGYFGFQIVLSLTAVLAGRLTDRWGTRFAFIIGLSSFIAVYTGLFFVSNQTLMFVVFALHGLHVAFTVTVLRIWITQHSKESQAGGALGFYGLIRGVCVLPANLFAGLLWMYASASWAFGWSAIGGIVLLVVFFRFSSSHNLKN